MAATKTSRRVKELIQDQHQPEGDLAALLKHVQENPILYAAGVAFVFLAIVAGVLFNAHRAEQTRDVATAYAAALQNEDPAVRTTALEAVPAEGTALEAEIVYMTAESAYAAGDYDKAAALFERVRAEFSGSEFAPQAVEGLGYVAEDRGNYDEAVAYYNEVRTNWANSFAAFRQPLNVGRVEEKRGQIEEAVAAYTEQEDLFPGSAAAAEAHAALDRLRAAHPDLVPPHDHGTSEVTLETLTPEAAAADVNAEPPGLTVEP